MALSKVTYVDGVTIIGAKNLNDIQDELIRQGEQQTADEESMESALALKADKSDTYTKAQVDTALNGKADKSTTYTKTEVDSALALKANTADVNSALALKADKSDTYTKAAVDASLALKADKSDTYTKTEVDNALALKADADDVYTKTETDTLLDEKANVDGSYEQMTVGNAEQIVTNLTDTESEPFTFRTSGGNLEIGDREELKVVGGSVVWNQLVGASTSFRPSQTKTGITYTVNNDGTFTLDGTASQDDYWACVPYSNSPIIAGHKYYFCDANHNGSANTFGLGWRSGTILAYGNTGAIVSAESNSNTITYCYKNNVVIDNVIIKPMLFDLTQMFGTTIADYIYNLEQSTAGAGVAFFKKYFPKDYYSYNAGEMLHVQTSEFKTVGFNAWDEELENGTLDWKTGAPTDATISFRSKNYISVLPSVQYYRTIPTKSSTYFRIAYYDADKKFISPSSFLNGNGTFTTSANCHFIKFIVSKTYYGNTYNNDICISIRWDGTRDGEYEEYNEHSYPLDDSLTLRGIPKLDANNNLYFDGDTYEHDGTVTRKYASVDMGTLNWRTGFTGFYAQLSTASFAPNSLFTSIYPYVPYVSASSQVDKTITFNKGSQVVIVADSAYNDAQTFKTAMSGKYLVYELATPTTEEAEPYQTPQIVDNWGTEEFVVPTQSGVEIPVGHETVYPISLRDKLESAPNLPDGDGDYLLHMTNGEATYKQLVSEFPSAPTTDGTYVLKATVSNGTATLTWVAE